MSDNLYARLGVDKSASVEDIRRAYKNLAREKHPDRGGDTEEFKQIQEAHEILCDENKRRVYDMTGSTSQSDNNPFPGGMAAGGIPFQFMGGMGPFGMPGVAFDMGDMFQHIFGGNGGNNGRPKGRKMPRGSNKHHDIGISLKDFYNGKEIKLKFNQARKCGACGGSGAEVTEQCGACNGSGVRTMARQIGPGLIAQSRGPCDVCNGEGTRIKRVCTPCNGKKFNEREKQLDIKITPGMREGNTIVFAGECSDSAEFETPGDVVLTLRRNDNGTPFDEYEWHGDNLFIRKTISYADSILGFSIECRDHPNGKSPVCVWRNGAILHGAVLQMKSGGMPKKEGNGYGDLWIQVLVTPPPTTAWTAEEKTKLQSVLGGSVASIHNESMISLEMKTAVSNPVTPIQ